MFLKRVFLAFGALSLTAAASAYSFAGSDWVYSYDLTVELDLSTGDDTLHDSQSNIPTTVTQTTLNEFVFDLGLPVDFGSGDFVVDGTTVTDTNHGRTSPPFTFQTFTLRVTYPTFLITGSVTGVNNGVIDSFGARAYEVTGNSVTVPNMPVELEVIPNVWIPIGTATATLNSWSMSRPVPEPASMAVLGLGLAAVIRRRKR